MKLYRAQILAIVLTGTLAIVAAASARAQTPAALIGSWRADTPLPSGVVQTFRFDADSSFDLILAVVVDGRYRVEGNKLVETVTLPGSSVSGTDTATVILHGDSLILGDASSPTAKTLHRPASAKARDGTGILGDWVITLPNGMSASYRFDPDGSIHIRARVSDERGTYTIKGNTLRLSSERTFQLPATTTFSVAGDVLTLTPASGQGARGFHRVAGSNLPSQ